MANLFRSGLELKNAGTIEFTAIIGTPTIVASPVRSGGWALKIASLVSGTRSLVSYQFAAADGDGPYYARGYFWFVTEPTASNTVLILGQTTGTIKARLTFEADKTLILRDEDGQIGSASSVLVAGTLYRLEMEFNRNAGVNSVVRARIDGTEFAGAADRAIANGVAVFRAGGNGNSEAQTQGEWYFDDLAVNDATGSFQNSHPGEGEIIHLHPDAPGDNAAWGRGGADSGANWSQVDEVTPNDATDYVTSNTAGQIDDYNLEATPAALASDDVINCVSPGVRFSISATTGADPTFVVRIKASSGGTVEESATIAPTLASWLTNAPAVPKAYPLTLYDLPGASATPWTKADLDTAQIGVRETTTDTHFVWVTALWLLVDHQPYVAPPATSMQDLLQMGLLPVPR